jgi:hypothetical protein
VIEPRKMALEPEHTATVNAHRLEDPIGKRETTIVG